MSALTGTTAVRRRGVLGRDVLARAPGPALASAAAVLTVACLLSGLSYPGFPVDAALCALLAATISVAVAVVLGVRALVGGRGRRRAALTTAVVTAVLVAGVVAARADDGQRLHARWEASRSAFEQEVRTVGVPARSATADTFAPCPGACPVRLGELSIAGCRSVDGGYLFLQAQGALTDDSGIVYLPESARPTSTWSSTETMTSLGGPWWSWTCGC